MEAWLGASACIFCFNADGLMFSLLYFGFWQFLVRTQYDVVLFFFFAVDLNEQFCEHQHQEHNVHNNLSLSVTSKRV